MEKFVSRCRDQARYAYNGAIFEEVDRYRQSHDASEVMHAKMS